MSKKNYQLNWTKMFFDKAQQWFAFLRTYQAKIQIFYRVKLIAWNLVNLSHFYFQFISNEKTNEAIAMNNTK